MVIISWMFLFLTMLFIAPPPLSAESFEARAKDWRIGAVVYQVFPDRFAPSTSLNQKRSLFTYPRRLRDWTETPLPSPYDPKVGYPHTLEFWGGDLASIESKLDYIESLYADVLYLTPIFQAYSNHRYDTEDYSNISPELGTQKDLDALITAVHRRKMRIVLDGVFNHMGKTSPLFQQAQKDTHSPYRDWFYFDANYPTGYRGWYGGAELPALKIETPAVRDYLWRGKDSIVRRYLKQGVDGWRLDVAYDLGPNALKEITEAAHKTKKGSLVVGEISGYPSHWFDAVDGVFNFFAMQVVMETLAGKIDGGRGGALLGDMVADAGIENILRSWLHIDNHDTARAANLIPDDEKRRLATALLFTLPGSPVLYYGSELGMTGIGDPQNRAPMRWDLANTENTLLQWTRRLAKIRRENPALRYGDFHVLKTAKLLSFARTTDRLRDTVIVVVNPTQSVQKETFATRVGRLMSWGSLRNLLGGKAEISKTGLLTVEVPPYSIMLLVPQTAPQNSYSPFDRIP